MIELSQEQMDLAAPFFEGVEETLLWSCLDGSMGQAWADGIPPRSVQVVTSCFCFLGGEPDRALAGHFPPGRNFLLVVDPPAAWEPLMRELGGQLITRYAIRKDTRFDREKLRQYRDALPEGYTLRRMDEELYPVLMGQTWSEDFCANFRDGADYARRGRGCAVLYEGVPVAGASSFSVYKGGIEIEIDTLPEHRRKGLALACGAALILDCLEAGLYPSWDAANTDSVALAEKLGYQPGAPYPSWLLRRGT